MADYSNSVVSQDHHFEQSDLTRRYIQEDRILQMLCDRGCTNEPSALSR